MQELVREIDPTVQLDEEVEEILLQIADDFVENTVNAACSIAKHRKVPKVEIRDVQLHLGKFEFNFRNINFLINYQIYYRTKLEYVDTWIWNR